MLVLERPEGSSAYVGAVQSLHVTREDDVALTDAAWAERYDGGAQALPEWEAGLWAHAEQVGGPIGHRRPPSECPPEDARRRGAD